MGSAQNTRHLDHLKEQALALAAKPTKSFHAFARALWAAHQHDRGFMHEVEKVAGIKRRSLFYLLNVGEFLTDYDVPEEQAERIGWTKLQIIARHVMNQPNRISQQAIKRRLRLAAQTPAHALRAVLEAAEEQSPEPQHSILLRIPASQYADVEAALLACGAKRSGRGLVGKEAAAVKLAISHLEGLGHARGTGPAV